MEDFCSCSGSGSGSGMPQTRKDAGEPITDEVFGRLALLSFRVLVTEGRVREVVVALAKGSAEGEGLRGSSC